MLRQINGLLGNKIIDIYYKMYVIDREIIILSPKIFIIIVRSNRSDIMFVATCYAHIKIFNLFCLWPNSATAIYMYGFDL